MMDEVCSVENCSFPLMCSKDRSLQFCTYHDDLPNASPKDNYKPKIVEEVAKPVVDDMADELEIRRMRREQSSKASQLIGQKMLQRWALLNEHCPNESCYAVPLVRNPDTKQMFCVICENIILTEEEALELEKKQQQQQQETLELEKKKQQEALEVEKKKKQQEQEALRKKEEEEAQQRKKEIIHSPISPLMTQQEERKRQKIEYTSFVSPPVSDDDLVSDHFSCKDVVSTLSTKMNELTERVKQSHDPRELSKLFKSIKQCAGAIQACLEANQACDKL